MTPLDLRRSALVVVHLQDDFVGTHGALAEPFRPEVERTQVLAKAARITAAARSAGVKVIYTRIAFARNQSDLVANSPLMRNIARGSLHVDGTAGAAIVEDVEPQPGDIVVTHQRLTGFHGTQLDVLLRAAGIDTVVFCGVATNLSVEGTARIASELGYRTVIVGDACATVTEAAHNASIASLSFLAELISTDDLLATLTPERTEVGA